MTTQDTEQAFREFLADVLDVAPDEIGPDTDLLGELEMDSLTVLELAVFSEERFGVDLEAAVRERVAGGTSVDGGTGTGTVTVRWLARHVEESDDAGVA